MYCIHCGKELPEDARFCSRCGKPQPVDTVPPEPVPESGAAIILPGPVTPPEPPEPPEIPEIPQPPKDPPKPPPTPVPELGQEFYDALAAAFEQEDLPKHEEPPEPTISVPPATEALSTVTPPEPPAEWKPPASARKPLSRRTIFLLTGVVLLVIALAAVAVRLTSPKPIGPDAIVYLTSDQQGLMFREDLKSGTEPKDLSDISGSRVIFSEDGNYLYFNNSGNLYRSDLNKAGEWDATEKISSGVNSYQVMKNGGAVYITGSDEDFRMYYYDGWDSTQLADGMNGSFGFINEAETVVYYMSVDEDGIYSYYHVPVDGSEEPEKVVDDFGDILYIDSDVIVYSRRSDSSFYNFDQVYSQAPSGETTLLAEDVGNVLSVTGEKGKITMVYVTGYSQQYGGLDLCKSEDGVVTVLVSGIDLLVGIEDDIYLYGRNDPDGVIMYYQNINGVESELPLDEGVRISGSYVLNGSEWVIALETPDGYALQAYKTGKNQLTPTTRIDGDLSNLSYGSFEGKDVLYYYVDVDYEIGEGTLMRYMDGESTVVARDVGTVLILNDGSAMFTMDESGVLFQINSDGQKERATNEATDYVILSGKKIAYVSHENLYVWKNGRTEKLAGGVERIFVPHEAEYTWYPAIAIELDMLYRSSQQQE